MREATTCHEKIETISRTHMSIVAGTYQDDQHSSLQQVWHAAMLAFFSFAANTKYS